MIYATLAHCSVTQSRYTDPKIVPGPNTSIDMFDIDWRSFSHFNVLRTLKAVLRRFPHFLSWASTGRRAGLATSNATDLPCAPRLHKGLTGGGSLLAEDSEVPSQLVGGPDSGLALRPAPR